MGNLKIPTRWKDESITQKAHQYGAKVDLVVRNIKWDASDKSGPPLREGEEKGLRLGKSFVVLNLVDEIVDAVNRFGFDGVVIDIKIPTDDEPRNVVPFFIKRLSDRLEKGNVNGRANDLLKATDKKLSVVITKNSDPFFIGTVVPSTYESVDFWLVDDEEFKAKVKKALSEEATKNTGLPRPKTALILLNTKRDKEDLTGTVVIWDVGNENGEEKWSSMLQNKIFGTDFNPKFQISRLVCSERATILLGLSVITPFLVLMLLLSWLIYDYPKFVKPAMATSALWGVLLIVVLAFLALLYSLPSLDPNHIGVYVILGSLVLPLVYIIWGVMSLLTKPRYP
ncbi:MAG: hypothetical protein IH873_00825 [Chloroflexi bacterium]|nr:hypothetical protein [Chloroflexota bacterium]